MAGFARGDRVAHEHYGPGTLTDINEYHTVIDFDDHGVRKFSTSMVVLQHTLLPAPERRKPVRARRLKS
ncbi:MAG: hypothetical protein ACE148_14805 [Vicinamibacterales bacterium]